MGHDKFKILLPIIKMFFTLRKKKNWQLKEVKTNHVVLSTILQKGIIGPPLAKKNTTKKEPID